MSENKEYKAGLGSDFSRDPVRIVFITKKTSAKVTGTIREHVMSYPHVVVREAIAFMLLSILLVLIALFWDAPLEQLANPLLTPNPAKAPWYFLGLQELLHYFPPVVAGVLIPGMVVAALIVIPYFNINIEGESLWARDRKRRLAIVGAVIAGFCIFLLVFDVIVALVPTLIIGGLMLLSARVQSQPPSLFQRWLSSKSLSFWIMSWFLVELFVLTAVGTFFRGPGWSWVWPWRS